MENEYIELKPGTPLEGLSEDKILINGKLKGLIRKVNDLNIELLVSIKNDKGKPIAKRVLFFKDDYHQASGQFQSIYERPDWLLGNQEYKEDVKKLIEAGILEA